MRYTEDIILEDWTGLGCHPLCLAIPEMADDVYDQLRDDIHGRGLEEPITLYEGMILDGRHRYRACLDTGVEPRFQEFKGPGSAYDFVVARNLNRRDLTREQNVQAQMDLIEVMRVRARARQRIAGDLNLKKGDQFPVPANLPEPGQKLRANLPQAIGWSDDVVAGPGALAGLIVRKDMAEQERFRESLFKSLWFYIKRTGGDVYVTQDEMASVPDDALIVGTEGDDGRLRLEVSGGGE